MPTPKQLHPWALSATRVEVSRTTAWGNSWWYGGSLRQWIEAGGWIQPHGYLTAYSTVRALGM